MLYNAFAIMHGIAIEIFCTYFLHYVLRVSKVKCYWIKTNAKHICYIIMLYILYLVYVCTYSYI